MDSSEIARLVEEDATQRNVSGVDPPEGRSAPEWRAYLCVMDTGIGIPEDKLPGIFNMFSQVEGSLSRSQGGLGIGLALAKRLVEMHDGVIEAESEGPGTGSTFTVRLPVLTEATRLPRRAEREETAPKSNLRILIVDDHRDSADSLGMISEYWATTLAPFMTRSSQRRRRRRSSLT